MLRTLLLLRLRRGVRGVPGQHERLLQQLLRSTGASPSSTTLLFISITTLVTAAILFLSTTAVTLTTTTVTLTQRTTTTTFRTTTASTLTITITLTLRTTTTTFCTTHTTRSRPPPPPATPLHAHTVRYPRLPPAAATSHSCAPTLCRCPECGCAHTHSWRRAPVCTAPILKHLLHLLVHVATSCWMPSCVLRLFHLFICPTITRRRVAVHSTSSCLASAAAGAAAVATPAGCSSAQMHVHVLMRAHQRALLRQHHASWALCLLLLRASAK